MSARRSVTIVLLALLSLGASANALKDIPPPPGGEVGLPPRAIEVMSRAMTAQVYTSPETPERIMAFYRAELPRRGWTSQAPLPAEQAPPAMAQLSPQLREQLRQAMQRSAMFLKGREMLLVAIDDQTKPGQTLVTLARSDVPADASGQSEEARRAAPQAPSSAPDSMYLPPYPSSQRVMASGDFHEGKAVRSYQTADQYQQVLEFYEREMPRLGWVEIKRSGGTARQWDLPEAGLKSAFVQQTIQYKGFGGLCLLAIVGMPQGGGALVPKASSDVRTMVMMNFYKFQHAEFLDRYGAKR